MTIEPAAYDPRGPVRDGLADGVGVSSPRGSRVPPPPRRRSPAPEPADGVERETKSVASSGDPVKPEGVASGTATVVGLTVSAPGEIAGDAAPEQDGLSTLAEDPSARQAVVATPDDQGLAGQPVVVGTRRANRRVLTPFLPADARAVLDQRAVAPTKRLPRGEFVVAALRREYEGIVRDYPTPDDEGGFAEPPKRRRRHLKEPVQIPLTLTEQQAGFLAEQVALTQLSVSAFITEALLRYARSELG